MEELKKEIDTAYRLIAAVPVHGDTVEVMAEARQRLRMAYKLSEKLDGEPEDANG